MKPKQIWANFAVSDLKRTTKFYTDLGFRQNGQSKDLTSFFIGEDNFIIHFFLKDIFRTNIKGEIVNSHKENEIIFTLFVQSKEEVDEWAQRVRKAGGQLINEPEESGSGYYQFIFADPDGHRFNFFFM